MTGSADIITWVIVFVGWWVVDHQNSKRQRRIEELSQVEKCISMLHDLENDAINYHTGSVRDESLSRDIRLKIQRISKFLNNLNLIPIGQRNNLVKQVRRSITMENFDSSNFKPQDINHDLIANISESIDATKNVLDFQFKIKYY